MGANLDTAIRVSRSIRAGTVSVNSYSEGDIATPFGGFKQSGFGGRDKGLEALDQYTEKKDDLDCSPLTAGHETLMVAI